MLDFPKPVTDLRPGMHVWYVQTETATPVEAVVCALTSTTEYSPTRDTQIPVPAAKLYDVGTRDMAILPWRNIYGSKAEAMKAIRIEEIRLDVEAHVQKFVDMMETPEDIVRFAWEHPVAVCEGTDWEARMAFERQVLDVMDIVLY